MSKHFKKIAFTYYPVKDMAASRAFYEGVLGLKAGEEFGGTWQEYDLGGTTFAIASSLGDFMKPGTQSSVSFEVNDLKALLKELQGKKASGSNDEPMETPVCWMAFVKDPDGNTVGLHQLK